MTYTQTGASNSVITLCNFCKDHLEGLNNTTCIASSNCLLQESSCRWLTPQSTLH